MERNKDKNFGGPIPIPLDTAVGFKVFWVKLTLPPPGIGLTYVLHLKETIQTSNRITNFQIMFLILDVYKLSDRFTRYLYQKPTSILHKSKKSC